MREGAQGAGPRRRGQEGLGDGPVPHLRVERGAPEPRRGPRLPKVTQPEAKVFPAPSPTSHGGKPESGHPCSAHSTPGLPPACSKSPSPPRPPLLSLSPLLLPTQPLALSKCSEKVEGLSAK